MTNLSVQTQAHHLATDLDTVVQTLAQMFKEVAPLEASVALLKSMLSDVGAPLVTAVEALKEASFLRSQADDSARARSQDLLDDVVRIVKNAQDYLIASERHLDDSLEQANRLSSLVGMGVGSGCAEVLSRAVSKISSLHETAEKGHEKLKSTMGRRNAGIAIADRIRKRTKDAEEAIEQASASVCAICDKIGELQGVISKLEIPSTTSLETVLPQLKALDVTSSDPLPDTTELEQLAVRAKKVLDDVDSLHTAEEIDAEISSAKSATDKACKKLRTV